MKKWILTTLLCICLGICATSCKKETQVEQKNTTQQQTQNDTEQTTAKTTKTDFLDLYQKAHDIYEQVTLTGLEKSNDDVIDAEGYVYHRVTDTRFLDINTFRTYLEQYFTDRLIDADILGENNQLFVEGKGGSLYMLDAGRGANIFYAGYDMQQAVPTDDGKMTLTATAYYTKEEPYIGELFTSAPQDQSLYDTTTYTFTLIQENGTWKFDTFALFY